MSRRLPTESSSVLEPFSAPGVTNVFVHAPSSLPYARDLRRRAPDLEPAADRALLLARAHDVVCVTRPVEPSYLEYLADVGVGPEPGRIVSAAGELSRGLPRALLEGPELLDGIARVIEANTSVRISSFVSSPLDAALARALEGRLGRPVEVLGPGPRLLYRCYRKDVMRDVALELGVPVARGELVRCGGAGDVGPLAAAVERQARRTGRAIVRGVRGTAGSSTLVVQAAHANSSEQIHRFLRSTAERVFLVDEMLEVGASPNVQLWIEPDAAASVLHVSDQRLEGRAFHRGNTFPSRARLVGDMVEHAEALAEWMGTRGYRGIAGFDFFEAEDPATGKLTAFFAEVNPRFNGASYPAALLERLRAKQGSGAPHAFATANVRTAARTFAEVARGLGRTLYRTGSPSGAFPYKVGRLAGSECTIAYVAPSVEEAEAGLACAVASLAAPEPATSRVATTVSART